MNYNPRMGTRYRGTREEIRALDAYIKLMRGTNTLRSRMEALLRKEGLTEVQLGVLEMLLHLGPMHQCDIGEKLLISRANVTLVVDQLAAKGWVRRESDPNDRRSKFVHLTAEGRRKIERLFPGHAARIAEAFSSLSAREVEELGKLAKKLGLGLGSANV